MAGQAGVDRKTARNYVNAALAAGLVRDGGEEQLTDELVGQVVAAVRPARPQGHGAGWEALEGQHAQIVEWVGKDLTVVKIGDLLARRGVLVAHRTLHRYCVERTDYRGRGARETVPVADGEPGVECQIDFARMGLIDDPETGRRRVVHAAACLATSAAVSAAIPASAIRRAGPSLTPSPRNPTACPPSRSAATIRALCVGASSANTLDRSATARNRRSLSRTIWLPRTAAWVFGPPRVVRNEPCDATRTTRAPSAMNISGLVREQPALAASRGQQTQREPQLVATDAPIGGAIDCHVRLGHPFQETGPRTEIRSGGLLGAILRV